MNEKYKYFKEAYEVSLKKRDSLKASLLNMIKLSPFFYGASYFLWTKREIDIVFTGDCLNAFNFILILQFLFLVASTLYAGITYTYPPDHAVLASPKKLSEHWDELERHNLEHGSSSTTLSAMQESLLPQYIENADINDAGNILMGKRLVRCGLMLIFSVCSSIVLILIFALGASDV